MRKFRKVLPSEARISLRAQNKKRLLDGLYLERYLQQEFEAREMSNQLVAFNLPVVKKLCYRFTRANSYCRICQFFSNRKQIEKFGNACPFWEKAFGSELRKTVINMALNNVEVNQRFFDIWKSRQVKQADSKPMLANMEGASYALQRRVKEAQRSGSSIPFVVIV